MYKEATLEEFQVEMQVALDAFIAYWRKKNGEAPDDWPMTLLLGDWDEQFMIWFDDPE